MLLQFFLNRYSDPTNEYCLILEAEAMFYSAYKEICYVNLIIDKMHFTILSSILFHFLPLSFAFVEVDLTRSLQLESNGEIQRVKHVEIELGKNCSTDSTSSPQRRTIARLVSNNDIDDLQSIRIKIRWMETALNAKPVLQFQIIQTKLGDEVKSGKQSQELQHIGCLLLTVTAAEQKNYSSKKDEIISTNRIAHQSEKRGVQFDLSHLRDVDVIIRFPTKRSNSGEGN